MEKIMKKSTIIIATCIVAIAAIIAALAMSYTPSQPTTPQDTTSVPQTTSPAPDVTTNIQEAPSAYNHSAPLCPFFNYVHPTAVLALNAELAVATDPDTTFKTSIDVADTVTITLPKQPLEVDITQLRAFVYTHENMKDPFLFSIDSYNTPLCMSEFGLNDDKTISTQFMIGYGTNVQSFADIILTYKNKIIYYCKVHVTNLRTDTEEYWKNQDSTQQYTRFHIQCGENVYTYFCVSTHGDVTLYQWTTQRTNTTMWRTENGYLVNSDKTWMIHESLCGSAIIPDKTYIAEKYQKHIMNFDFGEKNPENAISFLGLSQEEVIARLGAPNKTTTADVLVCLHYDIGQIFLFNDSVEQLTLNADGMPIANGVSKQKMFAWEINNMATVLGLTSHGGRYNSDKENKIYEYFLTIAHPSEAWTITYAWRYDQSFMFGDKTCTHIIVHSSPEFKY
jgi:hypothetical protein